MASASTPQSSPSLFMRDFYPAFVRQVSRRARSARNGYHASMAAEQLLLIATAIGGILTLMYQQFDLAEGVIVVATTAAFFVRLIRSFARPYRTWFEARGLAEELKMLAWLYGMHVSPYVQGTAEEIDFRYQSSSQNVAAHIAKLHAASVPSGEVQIPDTLRAIRTLPLQERIAWYRKHRLVDQLKYYHDRTRQYEQRAALWNVGLMGVELLAVGAAIAKIVGVLHIDLFGVAGTVVAAGIAWMEVKQFTSLADRYASLEVVVATDLGHLDANAIQTEEQWGAYVKAVELSLFQEHEGWLKFHQELAARMEGQPFAAQHLFPRRIKGA